MVGHNQPEGEFDSTSNRDNTLVLFDVDGTLSPSRKSASEAMKETLLKLRKKVSVGVVGGSDLKKIAEQIGSQDYLLSNFDYVFAENGLTFYQDGQFKAQANILKHLGEETLQRIINFTLRYVADLKIPKKRGTFVEYRAGMLNISPIGRNCSQEERDEFFAYDKIHNIRTQMVDAFKKEFHDLPLTFSIGGEISFDVFPTGWDKTYCLQYVEKFQKVYFFGDRTQLGGNDHEIFSHARTIGTTVTSPDDTREKLHKIFQL
ncbi:phosphomannomutase isoform 2 [Planoprotostelium fungivorum]|uniref:Phosphomannomutase n=1 Tax=Planoprotostelium fungivorum TaxID=1890364 RepID=A0A2P6NFZ3_9EUKA|nr:phosphomannomutase isoform 2 [Planoprotostelium fungivorum]